MLCTVFHTEPAHGVRQGSLLLRQSSCACIGGGDLYLSHHANGTQRAMPSSSAMHRADVALPWGPNRWAGGRLTNRVTEPDPRLERHHAPSAGTGSGTKRRRHPRHATRPSNAHRRCTSTDQFRASSGMCTPEVAGRLSFNERLVAAGIVVESRTRACLQLVSSRRSLVAVARVVRRKPALQCLAIRSAVLQHRKNKRRTNEEQTKNKRRTNEEQTKNKRRTNDEQMTSKLPDAKTQGPSAASRHLGAM